MKTRFRFSKHNKFYVWENHVSDGKWLVSRKALAHKKLPKPLRKLFELAPGVYGNGIDAKPTHGPEDLPILESCIPKTQLKKLSLKKAVYHGDKPDTITGFVLHTELTDVDQVEGLLGLESRRLEVGLNPDYARLVTLGTPYADTREKCNRREGIVVKDNDGELLAVVMPMRI